MQYSHTQLEEFGVPVRNHSPGKSLMILLDRITVGIWILGFNWPFWVCCNFDEHLVCIFAALLQKDCGFEGQCYIFDKHQNLHSLTVRLWDLGVSQFRGTSNFPVTYSSWLGVPRTFWRNLSFYHSLSRHDINNRPLMQSSHIIFIML